jgi:hypothetical protein
MPPKPAAHARAVGANEAANTMTAMSSEVVKPGKQPDLQTVRIIEGPSKERLLLRWELRHFSCKFDCR